MDDDDMTRQVTGGYDFGGYVPGTDYMPKRRSRRLPLLIFGGALLAAVVVVVLIIL